MDFQNQRVVVLGGTSGLGLATASAAAAAGATVTVVSSRAERVDSALALLPGTAEGHVCDLLDDGAVQRLFAGLESVDHLVYTAGEALQLGLVAQTPVEAVRSALELRVLGAYRAVRQAAPRIRPGGSITLVGGSAGERPQAGWSAGALICSGMEGLTRALAVELAPVRVNLVRPGVIRTDLWSAMSADERDALFAQVAAGLPVGRIGEAEDVAEAFLYAMHNPHATGSIVTVDGGTLVA